MNCNTCIWNCILKGNFNCQNSYLENSFKKFFILNRDRILIEILIKIYVIQLIRFVILIVIQKIQEKEKLKCRFYHFHLSKLSDQSLLFNVGHSSTGKLLAAKRFSDDLNCNWNQSSIIWFAVLLTTKITGTDSCSIS